MIPNSIAENISVHISWFTHAVISLGRTPDRGKVHMCAAFLVNAEFFSTVAIQIDPPTDEI